MWLNKGKNKTGLILCSPGREIKCIRPVSKTRQPPKHTELVLDSPRLCSSVLPSPVVRIGVMKEWTVLFAPMSGNEVSFEDIYLNELCHFGRFCGWSTK